MPQSLSQVYVHLTFSTKDRKPLIKEEFEQRLYQYLGGICSGLECTPIQIGGHKDHIHILCLLSRKVAQMKFVEEVKKQSSGWLKTIDDNLDEFYWQRGYGIFSVNPSEKELVINYIKNQKEHHRTKTFQEEYIAFLKKYNVPYDERYMWD